MPRFWQLRHLVGFGLFRLLSDIHHGRVLCRRSGLVLRPRTFPTAGRCAGQESNLPQVLGTQPTQWTPLSPDCSPFYPASYQVFWRVHRHAARACSLVKCRSHYPAWRLSPFTSDGQPAGQPPVGYLYSHVYSHAAKNLRQCVSGTGWTRTTISGSSSRRFAD